MKPRTSAPGASLFHAFRSRSSFLHVAVVVSVFSAAAAMSAAAVAAAAADPAVDLSSKEERAREGHL